MRDPKRIDKVIDKVRKVWKTYPDLRLGQLLENTASWTGIDLFYVEDDVLLRELETRQGEACEPDDME